MGSARTVVLVGALVGLLLFSGLLLGVTRTLASVILSFIDGRPMRFDLPIPGFPLDVVLVTKEEHIKVLNKANARLSAVPYDSLQPLFRMFFRTSRFHSELDGSWFVAFTQDKDDALARRTIIANALDKEPHTWDDVLKVRSFWCNADFIDHQNYLFVTWWIRRLISAKTLYVCQISSRRSGMKHAQSARPDGNSSCT